MLTVVTPWPVAKYKFGMSEQQKEYKLAVVIPAWNRPELWPRSMRSVLNQTVPVSLIISDDGTKVSAEGIAKELAAEFGEDRVTYVKTKGNQGPPVASNVGQQHTDADFIAVLCDDDEYEPTAIEHMSKPLIDNPEVDVVVGNVHSVHTDGNGVVVRDNTYRPTDAPGIIPDMIKNIFLGRTKMEAYMLRREAVEAVGGLDPKLFATDTLDLAVRLCLAGGKGYHVDELITHKYTLLDEPHAGSIDNKIASRKLFLEKNRSVFEKYPSEILAKFYYELASLTSVYGDASGARSAFFKSWLYNKKNIGALIRALVLLFGIRVYSFFKKFSNK